MTDLRIGVVGIPGKWSTEVLADALEAQTGFRCVVDMADVVLDLEAAVHIYKDQAVAERQVVRVPTQSRDQHENTRTRSGLL